MRTRAVILFAIVCAAAPIVAAPPGKTAPEERLLAGKFLGRVHDGRFEVFLPRAMRGRVFERLTTIQAQAAADPSRNAFDLKPHEGRVIIVSARENGGMLYEVELVEQLRLAEALQIVQNDRILEQNARILEMLARRRR